MRIESLKAELSSDQISISTALTQTKIFSQKLEENHEWIKQELEGYNYETRNDASDKLPTYRLLHGRIIDEHNRPIILDKLLSNSLFPWPIVAPITRIQLSKDDDNVLTVDITDVFEAFKKSFIVTSTVYPMQAKLIITNMDVKALLESVKNRLIEFLEKLIDTSKTVALK